MSDRKALATAGDDEGGEGALERCETCRFWGGNFGYCHRYPPVRSADPHPAAHDDKPGWCWPITDHDDWCGEYQPARVSTASEGQG